MKISPSKNGGRIVEGDTAWGFFRVEWDAEGNLVTQLIKIASPSFFRQAEVIPENFDPNTLKQRGCCDPPGD